MKIYLVDDEYAALKTIECKINDLNMGHEIIGTAFTMADAIEDIEENVPDVLITDVIMPCGNGIELIQTLKAKHPHMIYIVTSGFSEFEYAQRAISLDVIEYLLKPVGLKELENALIKAEKVHSEYQENHTSQLMERLNWREAFDDSSSKKLIAQAKRFFENNITKKITLKMLSDHVYVSEVHLCRVFKAEYNESPINYFIGLKITHAKSIFMDSPLVSIKDVATLLGFSDQYYFSKVFKKHTGISPSAFKDNFI